MKCENVNVNSLDFPQNRAAILRNDNIISTKICTIPTRKWRNNVLRISSMIVGLMCDVYSTRMKIIECLLLFQTRRFTLRKCGEFFLNALETFSGFYMPDTRNRPTCLETLNNGRTCHGEHEKCSWGKSVFR